MELGSIAAFGFSPLWLLAAASDISHGSRVYLEALVAELKRAGVVAEAAEVQSLDDLLSALEGASGTTARLVDLPPLELAGLRASLSELRSSASELPTPEAARRSLRGPPAHGRARAAVVARGVVRHGSRLSALGPPRRPRARGRALPGGLEAASRGGLRGLRAPGLRALPRRDDAVTSIRSERPGPSAH